MTGTTKGRAAWILATVLAGASTAWAQQAPQAQAKPAAEAAQKLVATTVNLNPGGGERLTIRILRWSTDEDRDRVVGAFKGKDEDELQMALGESPTLGYIWTSESLGYSLRYAQRVVLPDGGERILLATDRRLGVWTRGNLWKSPQAGAPDYPFTLIEIRIPKKGLSEGKTSIGAKIAVDEAAKALAIENYAAAPVHLKDIK